VTIDGIQHPEGLVPVTADTHAHNDHFDVETLKEVLGSNPVSWVIANDEHRVFHGGDSLWHGQRFNVETQELQD